MALDLENLKLTPLSELNLSGGAIQTVLDDLIYNALEPLVLNSTIFDSQMTYVLAKAAHNNKRKHSALERQKFISVMVKYHISTDKEEKLELLKSAKIERMFLFSFLNNWLKEVKNYKKLYAEYIVSKGKRLDVLDLEMSSIEYRVGFTRDNLYTSLIVVEEFKSQAEHFRNAIVAKYLKHAWKEAKKFVDLNKGRSFSFDDIYQNFIAAVSHGIDRYDSSKGALTSYINFWILREKTNSTFGFENGLAYSIPQGVKSKMAKGKFGDQNFSISIHQETEDGSVLGDVLPDTGLTPEESMESLQFLNRIRKLAKIADPKGIGRLYLDIDDFFSKKELSLAKQNMENQGIVIKGELRPIKIFS